MVEIRQQMCGVVRSSLGINLRVNSIKADFCFSIELWLQTGGKRIGGMDIEVIWQQYRSALKRFLSSKVSNQADVEDLLQTILIKTHKSLDTLKSTESVKPWLFQIANRSIIDFYRTKAKEHELTADDLWYQEPTVELEHEMAPCVGPFIEALPAKYSELLTAIDIQGQSQKDYASRQGLGYSTLKSRVQKGRTLLRQLFENCCDLILDQRGNVIECESKAGQCKDC